MSPTKFKIQRGPLEDAKQKTINLMRHLRLATKEVVDYNHEDIHSFYFLNIYYFWLREYLSQIEKVLELEGNTFLITNQLMQKIEECKNNTLNAEKLFKDNSNISLSIH